MADQPAPAVPAPQGPALVGREREQAVLRDALAAALVGRGSLVLIGGEAGIGKTTLAGAVCAESATQGATVLVGRCYHKAETPPRSEAFVAAPAGPPEHPLTPLALAELRAAMSPQAGCTGAESAPRRAATRSGDHTRPM